MFPNPVVAESILDRIVNTAHHVHMDGKSYRPNRAGSGGGPARQRGARTKCRRGTGVSGATPSTARPRVERSRRRISPSPSRSPTSRLTMLVPPAASSR
ncbi:MAG: hypothetical protein ACLQNG_06955 [Acidimicrobiales bacterium]